MQRVKRLAEALEEAWKGDPISAFGSVIACTEAVDVATAQALEGRFVEAIIAPDYAADALAVLQQKKNLRILKLNKPVTKAAPQTMVKQINGGLLVQEIDTELMHDWSVPTKSAFDSRKRHLLSLVLPQQNIPSRMRSCWCKSTNRVSSVCWVWGLDSLTGLIRCVSWPFLKAVENLKTEQSDITDEQIQAVIGDCVFVSEAFFPFADSIDAAHEMGAKYIVQPGGSIRDDEVIAACNKYGIAMAFTGMRHFKH